MCRHDENGLTSETEVIPQLNTFPYNSCLCHGVTLQHNRTVTATEVSTRERVVSVTGLTVRFTGEIQKTGLWAGKVVGCFKGAYRAMPGEAWKAGLGPGGPAPGSGPGPAPGPAPGPGGQGQGQGKGQGS